MVAHRSPHSTLSRLLGGFLAAFAAWTAASAQTLTLATSAPYTPPAALGSTYGANPMFTATVVPPANGLTPTGSVMFYENTTVLGNANLVPVPGSTNATASLTPPTPLAVGVHYITAAYSPGGGSPGYAQASGALPSGQYVKLASTTTSLAWNANPAVYTSGPSKNQIGFGSTLSFTATVTAPGNAAAPSDGTVYLLDAGNIIANTTPAAGIATFQISTLNIGTHAITAQYGGDANLSGSTASAAPSLPAIGKSNTTINLSLNTTTSVNPTGYGQPVGFVATVSSVSAAGAAPTGTVTFTATNQTTSATSTATGVLVANATGASSTASVSVSNLAPGNNSITANYSSGDVDSSPASSVSNTVIQTVNQSPTTVTLTSSSPSSGFGQAVTFKATVTPSLYGSSTPTGTVTFTDMTTGTILNSTPAPALSGGVATFTTSALGLGPHAIQASYPGDNKDYTASSTTLSQTVAGLVLASSVSPASTYGQSVTFTATVNPPSTNTPVTGPVTFVYPTANGGTNMATANLNSSTGAATLTIASLPVTGTGSYDQVQVSFGAGQAALASVNQTVNPATATVKLASTPNPSLNGVPITLTATVTGPSGAPAAPTGSVTLSGPGIPSASTSNPVAVPLNGSTASLTFTPVDPTTGSSQAQYTAAYSGDGNYVAPASSVTLNQSLSADPTTVMLTLSPLPSTTTMSASYVYGQPLTFGASVSNQNSGGPVPTLGTFTFMDGNTSLGTASLAPPATIASLGGKSLGVGVHALTASYGSATGFQSSTSTVTTVNVGQGSTTTTLSTSASAPVAFGSSVTLTAVVAVGGLATGTPTGTVTFMDNGTTLGSVLVSAGTTANTAKASFSTRDLAYGSHAALTAVYSGDTNFSASTSTAAPALTVIQPASTMTELSASPSPSNYGQAVIVTATVTGANNGTPTGTVTILDGTVSLGQALQTGTTSVSATYSLQLASTLAAGAHALTASFATSNAAQFKSSVSSTYTQTVLQNTTLALIGGVPTGGNNSATAGTNQSVTFTATVAAVAPGTGTPNGTVTFIDTSSNPPTTLGSANLIAGVATLKTPTLPPLGTGLPGDQGIHVIAATYPGTTVYAGVTTTPGSPTSPDLTLIIGADATTATVTSNEASGSVYGQNVTITATVTTTQSGGGTPTGPVTLTYGGVSQGTLLLSGGKASWTVTSLPVATTAMSVQYNNDPTNPNFNPNFSPSTGTFGQVVNLGPTSTKVSVSSATAALDQKVTFSATVSVTQGATGTPAGTVTFTDTTTNQILSGNPVPLNSGSASLAIALGGGTHSVTASFVSTSPNPTFANSASATPAMLTVNQGTTSTSVTVIGASSSAPYGTSLEFQAVVAPPSGLAFVESPFFNGTETVTFTDTTTGMVLGTGQVDGKVPYAYDLTTTLLQLGTNAITATYSGDNNYTGSSGKISQTMTAPSVQQVASSNNPSAVGQPVTFTAQVTPAPPYLNGSYGNVVFYDGTTTLGSAAVVQGGGASFMTAELKLNSAGTSHAITAKYLNGASTSAASAPVTPQVVNQLTATTTSLTVSGNNLPGTTNSYPWGQLITLYANIYTANSASVPSDGEVLFLDNGAVIGQASLGYSHGPNATYQTFSLDLGSHNLTAQYSGDVVPPGSGQFDGSASSATALSIVQGSSTIIAPAPASAIVGQPFTLTANVVPSSNNVFSPFLAYGQVTFTDTATGAVLNPVTLSGGTASLPTTFTQVGQHGITAAYAGDLHVTGSTTSFTQNVTTPGTFSLAPDALSTFRTNQTATLLPSSPVLPSGGILLTGGVDNNGNVLQTAELHDPSTGNVALLGMGSPRVGHSATLMPDGSVLLVGGIVDGNGDLAGTPNIAIATTSTELLYPLGAPATPVAPPALTTLRSNHTATLLWDGTVFIAGGADVNGDPLGSAEILNVPAGTDNATLALTSPRNGHTAILLPDGSVMLAGGLASGYFDPPSSGGSSTGRGKTGGGGHHGSAPSPAQAQGTAEIYVPAFPASSAPEAGTAAAPAAAPGTFVALASTMINARANAAAVLAPGAPSVNWPAQVLLIGGCTDASETTPLAGVESFNFLTTGPNPRTFSTVPFASLVTARNLPTANLLYDGTVLVVGGEDGSGNPIAANLSGEIYDPTGDTLFPTLPAPAGGGFTTLASPLSYPRFGQTTTLRQDGQVFIAGGVPTSLLQDNQAITATELFNANYPGSFTPPALPGTSAPVVPATAPLGAPATLTATLTEPAAEAFTYVWTIANGTLAANISLGQNQLSYTYASSATLPTVTVNALVTSVFGITAQGTAVTNLTGGPGASGSFISPPAFTVTDGQNTYGNGASITPGTSLTATVSAVSGLIYNWTSSQGPFVTTLGPAPTLPPTNPTVFPFASATGDSQDPLSVACAASDPYGDSSSTTLTFYPTNDTPPASSSVQFTSGPTSLPAHAPFTLGWAVTPGAQLTLTGLQLNTVMVAGGTMTGGTVTGGTVTLLSPVSSWTSGFPSSYLFPAGIAAVTDYQLMATFSDQSTASTVWQVNTATMAVGPVGGAANLSLSVSPQPSLDGNFTLVASYTGSNGPTSGSVTVLQPQPTGLTDESTALTLNSPQGQTYGPFNGAVEFLLNTSANGLSAFGIGQVQDSVGGLASIDSYNTGSGQTLPPGFQTATTLPPGSQTATLLNPNQAANPNPNQPTPSQVLLTGGGGPPTSPAGNYSNAIFLYTTDPDTLLLSSTTLKQPLSGHTATLLGNGTVLLAGGVNAPGGAPTTAAQIYTPGSAMAPDSIAYTGGMLQGRIGHTATLLPNGKVLVVGGTDLSGNYADVEVYDPTQGTFTQSAGTMFYLRTNHTASLTTAGTVLIAGGTGMINNGSKVNSPVPLDWAEIYDPTQDQFFGPIQMNSARSGHAAASLPNGQVLLAGTLSTVAVDQAELFQPSTAQDQGTFVPTGVLGQASTNPFALLLPTNSVLVAGGLPTAAPGVPGAPPIVQPDQTLEEIYNFGFLASGFPGPGFFGTDTALPQGVDNTSATATVLLDGRVLFAGTTALEVFDPLANATPVLAVPTAPVTPNSTFAVNAVPNLGGHYPVDGVSFTWTIASGDASFPGGTNITSVPSISVLAMDGNDGRVSVTCTVSRYGSVSQTVQSTGVLVTSLPPPGPPNLPLYLPVQPGQAYDFPSYPGYTYSMMQDESGGSITPSGQYLAGSNAPSTDQIQVVNGFGGEIIQVTVDPEVNPD
jgi:hypothetical protein